MHIEWAIVGAGLIVGFVVGLTGMGGGALMTPILVLVFGIQPLAAVSSDLVSSLVMKPFAGFVHARRKTVHVRMAAWLTIGSAPAACCGVLLLRALGSGRSVQQVVEVALGIVLLLSAVGIIARAVISARRPTAELDPADIAVKPVPTILIGALGGLAVGMTSTGSGTLIIVLLMLLYPAMSLRSLVGTDLVQAIPLVGAAAFGHLLFGDVQLGLTTSLIIGSVPGAYLGARLSAVASSVWLRRFLAVVLVATAMKLLNTPTDAIGVFLAVVVAGGAAYFGGHWLHRRAPDRPWKPAATELASRCGSAGDGQPVLAGSAAAAVGTGGARVGSSLARPANKPAVTSSAASASSSSNGTSQLPVLVCSTPTSSVPAVAIRYPTACANDDSDAADTASGARAWVKKIARLSAEPCDIPSTSTHTTAVGNGANTDPAMPMAVIATVQAMRTRWSLARCARTGMTSEMTRLPTPISASRLPAVPGLAPRERNSSGNQFSAE